MILLRLFPVILATLLFSAHFSRVGNDLLSFIILVLPLSFFIRKEIIRRGWQYFMTFTALVWIYITAGYIQQRLAEHTHWVRLAIIMAVVVIFNFFCIWWMGRPKLKDFFKSNN